MFEYTPLQAHDAIRVIRLRGAPSHDAPVECFIVETSLSSCEPFDAISYAWEGQSPDRAIQCDGQDLLVTKNCDAILRYFRPNSITIVRTLWIDAVCINQSTEAIRERSHQVGIMGQIYSAANSVCVWLGDDRDPSADPSELIWFSDIVKAICDNETQEQQERIRELVQHVPASTLDSFPWFRRLWAVQEIVLAKSAAFFFGSLTISFQDVLRGVDNIEGPAKEYLASSVLLHTEVVRWTVGQLKDSPHRVSSLLYALQPKHASDMKDMIFAAYGLLERQGIALPPIDYSKSPGQIYRETTRAVIEFENALDIFNCLDGLSITPNLPSWVPDFVGISYPSRCFKYCRGTGELEAIYSFSPNGLHLNLDGLVVATVRTRSDASLISAFELQSLVDNTWDKSEKIFNREWSELLQDLAGFANEIKVLYNIYASQVLLNFAFGEDFSSAELRKRRKELHWCLDSVVTKEYIDPADWRAWEETLMSFPLEKGSRKLTSPNTLLRRMKALNIKNSSQDNSQQMWYKSLLRVLEKHSLSTLPKVNVLKSISEDPGLSTCQAYFDANFRYMTFFKTYGGELGYAPHSVRRGDQIAIFPGARLPFLIRKEGKYHRIIAPVAIQRVIAQKEWPNLNEELETFCFV